MMRGSGGRRQLQVTRKLAQSGVEFTERQDCLEEALSMGQLQSEHRDEETGMLSVWMCACVVFVVRRVSSEQALALADDYVAGILRTRCFRAGGRARQSAPTAGWRC